jgi:hypothetical protein
MSKSFINDIDADKHKVEKYFTEIATIWYNNYINRLYHIDKL